MPVVVVVLKRVESCAVEVFQTRGSRAVMEVVPKVPEPPPPEAEILTGEEPMTVKAVQEALPVQDAVVVATV